MEVALFVNRLIPRDTTHLAPHSWAASSAAHREMEENAPDSSLRAPHFVRLGLALCFTMNRLRWSIA